MTRSDAEAALADAVRALPDTEVELLSSIAGRLLVGHRQYGDLKPKIGKMNFIHEASEELMDGCVYLAAQLMALRGSTKKRG